MSPPIDLSSTTNQLRSDGYNLTISLLRQQIATKLPSLSEIARRYSGNLWRPYQHPVSTAKAIRQTAISFGLGAGIAFGDSLSPTSLMLTDFPPVTRDRRTNPTNWEQPLFMPTNLIECARMLVLVTPKIDPREHAAAARVLDEALDCTTGYALLVGSTRPTLWAVASERDTRIGFGHTLAPIWTRLEYPNTGRETVRAAWQTARNDLMMRRRLTNGQRVIARKARALLLDQFRIEAEDGELLPIDRAIRVSMIAQFLPDAPMDATDYGDDEIAKQLRHYHESGQAKRDLDGETAYAKFASDHPSEPLEDDAAGIDEDNRAIEAAREYEDRISRIADASRESAVKNGLCTADESCKATSDDLHHSTSLVGDSLEALAGNVSDYLDDGSNYSGAKEEPDPRSVADIILDFDAAPITIK